MHLRGIIIMVMFFFSFTKCTFVIASSSCTESGILLDSCSSEYLGICRMHPSREIRSHHLLRDVVIPSFPFLPPSHIRQIPENVIDNDYESGEPSFSLE
jgi:hypothetical protein